MNDLIRRSDAIEAIKRWMVSLDDVDDDVDALEKSEMSGYNLGLMTAEREISKIPAVEPCNDAVSREWLLFELEEMNVASFYELNIHSKGAYEDMKRMLRDAPSVAVEPKQGKRKERESDDGMHTAQSADIVPISTSLLDISDE